MPRARSNGRLRSLWSEQLLALRRVVTARVTPRVSIGKSRATVPVHFDPKSRTDVSEITNGGFARRASNGHSAGADPLQTFDPKVRSTQGRRSPRLRLRTRDTTERHVDTRLIVKVFGIT